LTCFLKYVHMDGYPGNATNADLFTKFHQSFYKTFPDDEFKPYKHLIERYLNLYWYKPLTRRNKNFDKRTIDDHPWIPLQQACREFDVHKSTLRQALRQNLVRSKPLEKDRRVITMVFKPDLVDRIDRLRSLISAKEAATILGLTKLQFSRLRETGCFDVMVEPGAHGNMAWQFSRDEIHRYRDMFLKGLADVSGDYWSFPQLLQYFGGQIEDPLVTVLDAIEQKHLKVSARLNSAPGLSSMLFSKDDFLEWYERYKANSSLVSIPSTAKLLGLQQQFTYQLVEAGLIETSSNDGYSSRWVSQQGINDFRDKYVLLSKLAKKIQLNSRTLLNYLASREIYPIDQKWGQPLRQKVYERERLVDVQLLSGYI
jgi:hypothetical protein